MLFCFIKNKGKEINRFVKQSTGMHVSYLTRSFARQLNQFLVSGQIELQLLGLDDLLQDGIGLVAVIGQRNARRGRRRRLAFLEPRRLGHGGGRERGRRSTQSAHAIGSTGSAGRPSPAVTRGRGARTTRPSFESDYEGRCTTVTWRGRLPVGLVGIRCGRTSDDEIVSSEEKKERRKTDADHGGAVETRAQFYVYGL